MTYETILLDVECQRDFFLPDGSCYQPQADEVVRHVYRLFEWAAKSETPVISTVLRVRRGERGPVTGKAPHCIEETLGEKKLPGTVLPRRVNLGLLNSTDLPTDIFANHQQVIFEKRDLGIFSHARAERLITELTSATFVICGAGIAKGIVQAAIGLRSRGLGVILARDAVLSLDDPLTDMALLRMEAKGVVFATTNEIIAPKTQRRVKPFRQPARVAK
jgi:nicotinamidase-related amidase